MIPAAMGDEAEVPVWEEVHLQIFANHEITFVKILRDKITIIVNAVSGLKLFWGTIWFRLFAVLDAVLTWLLIIDYWLLLPLGFSSPSMKVGRDHFPLSRPATFGVKTPIYDWSSVTVTIASAFFF